jgi:hypothetical protein
MSVIGRGFEKPASKYGLGTRAVGCELTVGGPKNQMIDRV